MNDLISRHWLMECVNKGWIKFDTEKDENRFIHLVRDIAPSVQSEQRWIPCSERLPEDGTECLVSVRYSKKDAVVDTATYSTNLFNVHKEDFFDSRGESGWYYFDGEYGYCKFRNVIAWIPLPEPYKGEQK